MNEFFLILGRLHPLVNLLLLIIRIASIPLKIFLAVRKDFNPNIARTLFLIKRWSCATMLLRYFTCLIWMPTGIFFFFSFFISSIAIGLSDRVAAQGLRIVGDGNNWAIEPIFQNVNNNIEKYLAYLQPNSSYHPEKHHHNTTELITVMSGTITITVNNESYTLNQYDSISFSTNGTHSYATYQRCCCSPYHIEIRNLNFFFPSLS